MSHGRRVKPQHQRSAVSVIGAVGVFETAYSTEVTTAPNPPSGCFTGRGSKAKSRKHEYESFSPGHLQYLEVAEYTQQGGIFCFIQEPDDGRQMHLRRFTNNGASDVGELKTMTKLDKQKIISAGILILNPAGETIAWTLKSEEWNSILSTDSYYTAYATDPERCGLPIKSLVSLEDINEIIFSAQYEDYFTENGRWKDTDQARQLQKALSPSKQSGCSIM